MTLKVKAIVNMHLKFKRMGVSDELLKGKKVIIWILSERCATKSHQHHLCVVSTSHLSNQRDTWLRSIDMREICQPPCLFTGCADSLAACLFVYSLSRSKQMPSLFFPPLSLPHHPFNLSLCNSYEPCCADLFR